MQGDVVGCFLYMPEGGRPMESGKEVCCNILSCVLTLCLQQPCAGAPDPGAAADRSGVLIVWSNAGCLEVEK